MNPVISACRAVSEGHARHVLIYRTIQMLGGTILPNRDQNAPVSPMAKMFYRRRRCQVEGHIG